MSHPSPPLNKNGVYTREEVAKHNNRSSCWLIVDGSVYDVTVYIDSHPAGSQSILRRAGQDATVDFNFHSRAGKLVWEPYKIGALEGTSSCRVM
jgi:cytochrome b involved in lipid metabolism